MDLSVVIPIYNESLNIQALYDRLSQVASKTVSSYELLFVNDGSADDSLNLIQALCEKDNRVRYIDFSRNFGHQIAVMAGLDHALGDAVVIIDADLQDPPEVIAELYAKYKAGNEVVYARRKSRKGEGFFKKLTAKWFYRILKSITSIDIPIDTGDFRIIDRKVVDILKKMPESHKYLRGQISWVGFRQTFVEYDRAERQAGETGYTVRKMMRFAMDGITSFSNFPLRLATILGFTVSSVAFLVLLYSLYMRLFTSDYQPGWASVITSVLFLGGVQLITIGLIGEYIGRVNTEVKKRPLYIINETSVDNQDSSSEAM